MRTRIQSLFVFLTFIAAVVGTMAVGIVGNAHYIERAALLSALEQWL